MHGNFWEWTQDVYHEDKEGGILENLKSILSNMATTNIQNSDRRVIRGGSFLYQAGAVRSAYRYGDLPEDRNGNIGFRPVRTVRHLPAKD